MQSAVEKNKDNNPENAPLIIACGICPNKISSYFVYIDNVFIKTKNTALDAIDRYLKLHYILNIEFESNLRHMLSFIFFYIFKIGNEDKLTSQMKLIHTALMS